MKTLFVTIMLVLSVMSDPAAASCDGRRLEPAAAFEKSDVVFSGVVSRRESCCGRRWSPWRFAKD